MVQSQTIKVNPLRIVSAVLLIISPFLSWITVSAFGLTAQATLIDVTQSTVPLQIPTNLPIVSLLAAALLVLGGMILFKAPKIGLPIAGAGILAYLSLSYTLYGSPTSVIPIVIAPGIGLLTALVSIGIGTVSLRTPSQALNECIQKAKTRQGLTVIGLFVASVSLTIDGLNHTAQRELSAFIGTGLVEPIFHIGFVTSIFLLAVLFSVRRKWGSIQVNSILIASAFAFIMLDAAYHLSNGEVSGFLGHDAQEMLLHISTYYGAAFLLVAQLLRR